MLLACFISASDDPLTPLMPVSASSRREAWYKVVGTERTCKHLQSVEARSLLKVFATLLLAFNPAGWQTSTAASPFALSSRRPWAQTLGGLQKWARSAPRVCMQLKKGSEGKTPALGVGESTKRAAAAIVSDRFNQGDWWEWLYRDPTGQPSSWERYSVRAVGLDGELVIDMASRFSEDEEYNVHHRMCLSLGESLAATEDGLWCEAPHRDNVQAFEEKFNVFLMQPSRVRARIARTRTREVTALGRATLVQSPRHNYTSSWYVQEPRRYAGLAAFKAFGPEKASSTYTFELVRMGNDLIAHAGSLSSEAYGRSPFGIR